MKYTIAIVASLLVNLSLVIAFERSAHEALPKGEVIVTELGDALQPALVQAATIRLDAHRPVAL